MKACPIDHRCFAFESMEGFYETFERFAERETNTFNDHLVLNGNDLNLGDVKKWLIYFGVENVYFSHVDDKKFNYVDEFYFDLKNGYHLGSVCLRNPDEISIYDGFLRIWFE